MRDVVDAVHQHIDVAIVIEIAECAPAPGHFLEKTGAGRQGNIGELPVSEIAVEFLALPVARFNIGLAYLRIDMTVANEDIEPAVIVEIQKAYAPTEEARILAEAGLIRLIVEGHVSEVPVEAGGVAREVRFHEIKLAVAIVIAGGNTHAGLRLPVRTVGDARFDRDIGKRTVVVVLVKR